MKRLFFIVAAALAVSCGSKSPEMHFDKGTGRAYYNPELEMDTLSYSVAMNIGLGLRFQPTSIDFNYETLIEAMKAEMAKESVDMQFIESNKATMNRFSEERLRPYTLAKRMAMGAEEGANLPELFDDGEFSRENLSRYFGHDIAEYIRRMGFEVNMYWVYKAIGDAAAMEGDTLDESALLISQDAMRKCLNGYFQVGYKNYMTDRTREWLADVAAQRDVNMMVVENDTLYYRVDVAGNGVRPRTLRDTVAFSYDVYTQRGALVESLDKRVASLREALDKTEADTTMNAQIKDVRLNHIRKQLDEAENLDIVLGRAMIKGSQYGIQNIGEGGTITLWLPASLAYGERGNKAVAPNEGVVMTISLKSVKYGKSDEEIAAEKMAMPSIKKVDAALSPKGNGIVKPGAAPQGMPMRKMEGKQPVGKEPKKANENVVITPVSK